MSELSTFELGYSAPERVNETIMIDETVSHIDILLPQNVEQWQDGLRWVNTIQKALRLSRIDERSLVISDLSALTGDHATVTPVTESEFGQPFDVMDIHPEEPYIIGREHNPSHLPLLQNVLVSHRHLAITPHLGELGLGLTLRDLNSTNGSSLRVHRAAAMIEPSYERLFA